jgi:hypothetical protein
MLKFSHFAELLFQLLSISACCLFKCLSIFQEVGDSKFLNADLNKSILLIFLFKAVENLLLRILRQTEKF